jgi:hypothetical protein
VQASRQFVSDAKPAADLRALGCDRISVSAYRLDALHVNSIPSCRSFSDQPSAITGAKTCLPGLIRSAVTGAGSPKTPKNKLAAP